jgi:hypothetical protein
MGGGEVQLDEKDTVGTVKAQHGNGSYVLLLLLPSKALVQLLLDSLL